MLPLAIFFQFFLRHVHIFQIGQDTVLITDFTAGTDQLQLIGSIAFSDLTFAQADGNTTITAGGTVIATLAGVTTSPTATNFV